MTDELMAKFTEKCREGIEVYGSDIEVNKTVLSMISARHDEVHETWRESFEDEIYNWYNPIDNATERHELMLDICRDVGIDYESEDEDIQQELEDVFGYEAFYKPDYDSLLKQKVCIDIFIDSGDYNLDLGCNQVYPHYNGDCTEPLQDQCCLVWLAKSQGYTKEELQKNLYGDGKFDNRFFEDVYNELNNCTSHMNSLVFLKRMTFEEYLNIKDGAPIHINKDDRCGLFDSWSGAGGLLDIRLEKDIDIDPKDIHSVEYDEGFKFNIHDVYGVTDTFWEGD